MRACSETGRRRLVIENDETLYTVEDCLRVHAATGARRRLRPPAPPAEPRHPADRRSGAGGGGHVAGGGHAQGALLVAEARLAHRDPRKKEVRAPPLLSQHADYVHPWEFAAFLRAAGPVEFDVMLEAKMKDAALLKLRGDMEKHRLWPEF